MQSFAQIQQTIAQRTDITAPANKRCFYIKHAKTNQFLNVAPQPGARVQLGMQPQVFQLRGAEGSYEIKFNNMTLGSRATLGSNHISLEEPNGFKRFTFRKVEKGYYTMVVSNGCYYFDRMELNLNGTVSLNTALLSKKNDAIFSLILVDNGRPIENPPF